MTRRTCVVFMVTLNFLQTAWSTKTWRMSPNLKEDLLATSQLDSWHLTVMKGMMEPQARADRTPTQIRSRSRGLAKANTRRSETLAGGSSELSASAGSLAWRGLSHVDTAATYVREEVVLLDDDSCVVVRRRCWVLDPLKYSLMFLGRFFMILVFCLSVPGINPLPDHLEHQLLRSLLRLSLIHGGTTDQTLGL